jgi:hypothetical protein
MVLVLLALPRPLATQGREDTDRFVAAVREATAAFQDRRAAQAAGYRRVGPDFPGMGEHWVHVARLLHGGATPAAPPILSYAAIDGIPTLVGVAFAVAVGPGAEPPPAPAGCGAWHYHAGSIEDESFLPGHAEAMGDGVRLAVLHTWVWLDNPAGLCASDNWALPYVRAGLTPAGPVDPDAARALALVTGARAYYRVRWLRLRPGRAMADVDALLDRGEAAVRAVLAEGGDAAARDARLAAVWRSLCAESGDHAGAAHH